MDTEFLDWALADFSGYVAADALDDGPFCRLSVVDNRCHKRILSDVLDHDPNHEDIRAFLGRLKTALDARDLTLRGVTTDGSSLYPTPLAEVFRGVPHQLCQFHVVKDIVKAVLGAVSSARKALAAKQPKLGKGRPSTPAAKQAARTKKRLAAQGAALFSSRHLFVQRHLNKTERKTLLLSPLRKLAKITAEKVNHLHRKKVGHWVLLAHCFVSKVHFLVLFLWLWFIFL